MHPIALASGMTLWEAVQPGLALALFLAALLPWLDRENGLIRTCAMVLCAALMWRYMLWRIFDTLPPAGFSIEFLVGLVFAGVEALAMIGGTASLIFLTRTRSRTAEADRNEAWLESLPQAPLIDVLICTFNEGEAILERTILGALAADYPRFRVWVCDDGKRAWLAALCERLECGYITRPDNAHAKAGNINNALRLLADLSDPPEFIAILDADFVPTPIFLKRAVSLMREADVAVVQTPQHFFNPDPIQANLAISPVWPDEQRFFFDIVMASKDAWGAAFCCGTSSVIRFAPLMHIGGFPTDSVTEDYLLSLRLREVGFRTVYLNEPLSLGLAPEGLKEYITQRSRWCLGFVQICRGPSGPLKPGNGLRLVDRAILIETFLHWAAAHTFRILGIVVVALYLLFDIRAVHAEMNDAVDHFMPFLAAQSVVMVWLTRSRVLPVMADLSQLLAAPEIIRSVAAGLIKRQGHKFKVTAKGGDRSRRLVQWPMLRIFLSLLLLTAVGILYRFTLNDSEAPVASSAICLFWAWYNMVILVLACLVCVEARQIRKGERLRGEDTAVVLGPNGVESHPLRDLSVSGICIMGRAPGHLGERATIRLGDLELEGTIVRVAADNFALRFEMDGKARHRLVRRVYSGRYSAAVTKIKPLNVATAVVMRVFE
jgi:cellulose synthase (UDP-forming)